MDSMQIKQQEITERFNALSGTNLEFHQIFIMASRLSIYSSIVEEFIKVFDHAKIYSNDARYRGNEYKCIDAPYYWAGSLLVIFDSNQLAMEIEICGGWDEWYMERSK